MCVERTTEYILILSVCIMIIYINVCVCVYNRYLCIYVFIHPFIFWKPVPVIYTQYVLYKWFIDLGFVVEELWIFADPDLIKYSIFYLFQFTFKDMWFLFCSHSLLALLERRIMILENSTKGKARTSDFLWKLTLVSKIIIWKDCIQLK